jgi:hypothetical protein
MRNSVGLGCAFRLEKSGLRKYQSTMRVFAAALALLGSVLAADGAGASAVEPPAPAVDEQSRALARDLAQAETEVGSAGNFALVERAVSIPISTILASGKPELEAELTTKVHEQLTPWREEYTAALVEAYSENLTASEMRDITAFLRGPGGRAEVVNLPLLKKNLASAQAMEPDMVTKLEADSDIAFQQAREARRDLIERIFKSQNLEERTAQGFRKLYSTLNAAVSVATSAEGAEHANDAQAAPLFHSGEITKQVEADVRRTMAVERAFYLTHYSDEELDVLVTYLESSAGQAVMTQLPAIRQAVGRRMVVKLDSILPSLIVSACATTSCSTQQKDRLKQLVTVMHTTEQTALTQ